MPTGNALCGSGALMNEQWSSREGWLGRRTDSKFDADDVFAGAGSDLMAHTARCEWRVDGS